MGTHMKNVSSQLYIYIWVYSAQYNLSKQSKNKGAQSTPIIESCCY